MLHPHLDPPADDTASPVYSQTSMQCYGLYFEQDNNAKWVEAKLSIQMVIWFSLCNF